MGFDVKAQPGQGDANFEVKGGKTPKKKKKKKGLHGFGKFLVIFLSIIIGIPVVLVGALYGCFYDGTHTEVDVNESFDKDQLVNNLLVDSLDNAATDHAVSLELKKIDINSLLHNYIKSNATLSQFIPNLYVDTVNDNMTIVAEGNAMNFFKTRLFIDVHYSLIVESSEETICFDITNVKLGRISGMQNVVKPIMNFVGMPDLSSVFEKAGLRIKVDLPNLKMTYKVKDFTEDILSKMGGGSSDFLVLVKEILSSDNFADVKKINGPTETGLFSFGMDLEKVRVTKATHGVDGYVIPDGYFNTQLEYVRTQVTNMLNNGIITKEYANTTEVDLICKYIMGGNALVSPTDNEILRLKDLHAFDGMTIPQYNYNLDDEFKLENILKTKLPTSVPLSEVNVTVTIDEINKALSTTAATGVIASFMRNEGTEEAKDYKVNYVCSDRIGVLINNDTLYLIINMNVNGYAAQLTLVCPKVAGPAEFGKITFSMGKLKFGDIETSDEVKSKYMSVINEALGGAGLSGVISASGDNIVLDVGSILSAKGINESNCNLAIALDSYASATNPGGISLTLSPKI